MDNYCERTAPGLWGEPANALSNLGFLLASALLLWLLSSQPSSRRAPASVWLLPIMLGVVGLCSLAFHTFATTVTGALDSLSIIVFILVAVIVIVHWMWGVRWRWAVFAASLTLRTPDEPLCENLSLGTHFAWHLLNASVLFVVAYVVIRRRQACGSTARQRSG